MKKQKVLVIDIDLGVDVDTLIAKCSKDLTKEAREQLDGALAAHLEVKQLKDAKATAKQAASDGISTVLNTTYKELEAAGQKGILTESIFEIVKQHIPTTSAFTLRMNKYLASIGNPYRMVKIKRGGEQFYVFESFNEEINS